MPERIAILVIHGIGQQQPYETLDQFTRNLLLSLDASLPQGAPGWRVEPQLDHATDPTGEDSSWTRVSYRLLPPEGATPAFTSDPSAQIQNIDLFEYYWAPITQDKITYTGSLRFLIQAGLKPFLYLASNLNALGNVQRRRRWPFIAAKEIFRQAFLFLPLVLLFLGLLWWLQSTTAILAAGGLKSLHVNATLLLSGVLLGIRYLYLYTSVRALRASFSATPGDWQRHPLWRAALTLAILLHLFVVPLLFHLYLPRGQCPMQPWDALKMFFLLNPCLFDYWHTLVLLLLAWAARYILVDYVGDVAVYVNSSQFARTYKVRTQILNQCSAVLGRILTEKLAGAPAYDRVLIASHSLGTVIAYDTMNALLNVARTADPADQKSIQAEDLNKLRGLLTFGSPLNKIFYFFREQDNPMYALRRQSLNLLNGFRLKQSLTHPIPSPPFLPNPDPRWAIADRALATGFCWINAYSIADPISGKIAFFDVEQQQRFRYRKPFVAHLEYWEDPALYTFFRKYLL